MFRRRRGPRLRELAWYLVCLYLLYRVLRAVGAVLLAGVRWLVTRPRAAMFVAILFSGVLVVHGVVSYSGAQNVAATAVVLLFAIMYVRLGVGSLG